MNFRGKEIDPVAFWAEYCEIKEDNGPFLPLCHCPNPEHNNTRSPAFQINISRPTVHCFSHCGISGSYEHAVCVIEGFYEKYKVDLEFDENKATREEILQNKLRKRKAYREARKHIYKRSLRAFGTTPRTDRHKVGAKRGKNKFGDSSTPAKAQQVKEINLGDYSYLPKEALKYLEERNINPSSRARWQIGFDEDLERVTIPVRDHRDRLRFLIKRAIYNHQRPAYLYPDDSAKTLVLFGACNLDRSMVSSQGLIVVEGSIDCIRLHQHGFRNTVAVLGAYVSDKQRELIAQLRPKRIYAFFDKDGPGVWALEAASEKLSMYQIKVPLYPKGRGLDPAALTREQVEVAIGKAVPVFRVKQKIKQAKRKGAIA